LLFIITTNCLADNEQSLSADSGEQWTGIKLSDIKANTNNKENNLLQLQVESTDNKVIGSNGVEISENYIGCGLGAFWCVKLRDAGVKAVDASKLSIQPDNKQPPEWFYDNKPTCIGYGEHYEECSFSSKLICSGESSISKDNFGYSDQQIKNIIIAINNNGTHPNCPGCTVGRNMEHSPTTCLTEKGKICEYSCDLNYVPEGQRICYDNGTLLGGHCKVEVVDVTITELSDPSPSPSPSAFPIITEEITQQNITHENWTNYQNILDEKERKEYSIRILSESCKLLLDIENYEYDVAHVLASRPIRVNLKIAAKKALCGWIHDEMFQKGEEKFHFIPKRGDHGPWTSNLYPNIIHIKVDGIAPMAVVIDLKIVPVLIYIE